MEHIEENAEQQMIYLLPSQRKKLAELQAKMEARSLSHVVGILIDAANTKSARRPQVHVDAAILQPSVQHQTEPDGDAIWA